MISIHQSQFLPWLPYFYKIIVSDVFIILDNVQYQKNGVQNRNMILTSNSASWLTIPVISNFGQPINEVKIANTRILKKIIKTIELNYKKAKYFEVIFPKIANIFEKDYHYLHDLNINLLFECLDLLSVEKNIKFSSDFHLNSKKNELIIDLILHNNENNYLSGKGALEYMDINSFRINNIKISLFEFEYKPHPQLWAKDFIPNLSIIDLLFNNYENALNYILENGNFFEYN